MSVAYGNFVDKKLGWRPPSGIKGKLALPASLFPHQLALTKWALRRGRSAIFADTGLGKSRMEVAWADAVSKHTTQPVLILTPLAVAAQTADEAAALGISACVCRDGADVRPGINITNYERLHRFDAAAFGGVVLDESSVIKHHDAKTFRLLTEAFRATPFKLPATATPAPNDWTELGTHAEFLGICTSQEMLSEFFVHDGGDTQTWRLKGHARTAFWRWVVSWGALIRRPSDLGFDDSAYVLPPLHLHEHTVESNAPSNGMLFAMEAQTLSERRDARRASMAGRIGACVETIFNDWNIDGLEARVRGESEGARGRKPGAPREAHCLGDCEPEQRPGSAQSVHGRLLQGQPGQVSSEDAGTASGLQRGAARALRDVRSNESGEEGRGQSLARGESGEAPRAAASKVRPDAGPVRLDDGGAGLSLCDLQAGGSRIPDDRSLSHDRSGPRTVVHAVQSGDRKAEGQRDVAVVGNRVPQEPWLIWCELNDEQDALEKAFGLLAFSVRGANTTEEKEEQIRAWLARERPVMISKPSVLGWGLNFQHCRNQAFVGVTDSFEAYYQAVRRCWRFGQKRPVHVHLFSSSQEGAVAANLKRKERDAGAMADALSAETRDSVMTEVTGSSRQTNIYAADQRVSVPAFLKAAS